MSGGVKPGGNIVHLPIFELRAGSANLGIAEEDFRARTRAVFRVPAHMLGREYVTRFSAVALALVSAETERIETVKIEMLTEAARLEKELRTLKGDAARIAGWHDGRVYIEGISMQIHELFRPAVETMFSTGIEVAMKSVKDQLRAIGVDPDEEK